MVTSNPAWDATCSQQHFNVAKTSFKWSAVEISGSSRWANGFHVMLDSEVLVTVRWEQVEGIS